MINKAINDLRKRLNARVLARFGHFAHIMWTGKSRWIWHNFVKVGDNWTKISNLGYIGTCNRCVKNRLKIFNRLWEIKKNSNNLRGGIFLTHTVDMLVYYFYVFTFFTFLSNRDFTFFAVFRTFSRTMPAVTQSTSASNKCVCCVPKYNFLARLFIFRRTPRIGLFWSNQRPVCDVAVCQQHL